MQLSGSFLRLLSRCARLCLGGGGADGDEFGHGLAVIVGDSLAVLICHGDSSVAAGS